MPWIEPDLLLEKIQGRLVDAGHPPVEVAGVMQRGILKLTIRWASGRDWALEIIPEVEEARAGETDEWVARKALAWLARGRR